MGDAWGALEGREILVEEDQVIRPPYDLGLPGQPFAMGHPLPRAGVPPRVCWARRRHGSFQALERDVGQHRREPSAWRDTRGGWAPRLPIHPAGGEPLVEHAPQTRDGVHRREYGRLVDAVKALGTVRIQPIVGAIGEALIEDPERLMRGPPGPTAAAVGRESRVPRRFARGRGEGLSRAVCHDRHAQWAFCLLAWLGSPHPSDRTRVACQGRMPQRLREPEPWCRASGCAPIDTGRLLAAMILCDTTDGQGAGGS
jgi:hypothetical protein